MNVGELTEWILENREGNAFLDWTERDIIQGINYAIHAGTLLYALENGHLQGVMVMATLKDKELFIEAAVTTKKGVLVKFAQAILERFPGYRVTAKRNGRIIQYDMHKVVNLLKERTCYG